LDYNLVVVEVVEVVVEVVVLVEVLVEVVEVVEVVVRSNSNHSCNRRFECKYRNYH
jgi:NADH:ubiquinone oxidoreductase subunit 3 (subunit A)